MEYNFNKIIEAAKPYMLAIAITTCVYATKTEKREPPKTYEIITIQQADGTTVAKCKKERMKNLCEIIEEKND